MTDDEILRRLEELESRIGDLEFHVKPRWVRPEDLHPPRKSELSPEEQARLKVALEATVQEYGPIPFRKGG